MRYPALFEDLLRQTDEEYIGIGNPAAPILMIANEPALDLHSKEGQLMYHLTIRENRQQWLANVEQGTEEVERLVDDEGNIPCLEKYNPLFPFKGQKYKVRRKKKDGSFICCDGTSKTWYEYQKLIDYIRGKARTKDHFIDFHRYCFSTDFSTICALRSSGADSEKRTLSIQRRLKLFSHDFFQQFPIVILPCGHYVRDHGINPWELFHFQQQIEEEHIKKRWINIHKKEDGCPHILIHTMHFASSISKEYLSAIANLCKPFLPS